jgi:hypothetical protein
MSTLLKWMRDQPMTTAGFLVQRQIKNPDMRERIGAAMARTRPRPRDGARINSPLVAQGYEPIDIVGAERAAEMRAYFEGLKVRDLYGRTAGDFWPSEAGPDTHVAYHEEAATLMAPHALAIANDPGVLAAVSEALGAKPLISSMATWWSIPHPGKARDAELFHRDVDDWRFVKLFVYLTDVDEESGPHAYVPGSHRSPNLRDIRRYTDEEVEAAYPGETIIIKGKAGDAFLENTQGLHRGIPPRSKMRLLFQVIYSLSRSPYGPPKPLARYEDFPGLDLDPYINQVYLA